jgi:hypothetical protein
MIDGMLAGRNELTTTDGPNLKASLPKNRQGVCGSPLRV